MTGIKSRWFVEIFLDGETVRFWNDFEAITFDGVTFQPLGDRFVPPDKLRRQANLKSETTKLQFDSSRQLDNGDILADLLDAPWRRRQIRIRNVHYSTTPDAGDVISDTYGRIRGLSDSLEVGKDARVEMEIESGSLSYLERRMQTRSAENQKRVFPGDVGFDLTKVLEDVPIIWRTKETKKGSVNPIAPTTDEPEARVLPVGEFMTEGTFVAHFATQQQKKNWIRVFAIADAEIQELNEVWINGEKMISAPLSNGVRTAIPALNSGGTRAWITFHNGAWNQTADTFLDSVEAQWTTNHRLRGVAYVVIEHLWDDDNPTAFDYKFGGKGAKFYDRRLDTTAGGSGSHRLVTPSTWAYTKNPMVIADHYRQGIRIMPSTEPLAASYWFGVGEAADVMPYAEYADLADLCDENVTLKAGGTQKRYEAHGLLSAADDHKKNLEKLASAMAARVIDTSGRIVFRPVRTQSSILTLVDGDMINTASTEYDPTGRIDDMANTIEGRFLDKRNAYKPTDYPPVSNAAYITADGDVISDTRNFDLEVDGERAQRLALLNLAYSRRIATLKETFLSSKVRALKPGDWFTRSSALRGFEVGKLFEVDQLDKSSKGTTTIEAVEVDPDQQAWDETAAATLSIPPTVDPITLPALDAPAVTVTAFSYSGGGATVPAVRLAHAAYLDFIGDEIVAEFGVSNGLAGGSLGITGQSGYVKLPGNVAAVETLFGLPPAVAYAIRFRARQGERYSAWSAFQAFTSTGVYEAATSGIASSIIGQGALATLSQAAWATQVTGVGKPEDYATLSRVIRQETAPSSPNTNDIWVQLSGSTPIAVHAWNGSAWLTASDITLLNTAAGFVGQGWGATASEAAASNAQIPLGQNVVVNSSFARGTYGWQAAWDGNTGLTISRAANLFGTGVIPYLGAQAVGTPPVGALFDAYELDVGGTFGNGFPDLGGAHMFGVSVIPGQRWYIGAEIQALQCTSQIVVNRIDNNGAYITQFLHASGPYADYTQVGAFYTIPDGTYFLKFYVRAVCNGAANPTIAIRRPMAARVTDVQTVAPAYSAGPADPIADQTGSNTAAALAGQGWGATANEASASNLYPYNRDAGGGTPIPDWNFTDAAFWNNPAPTRFVDGSPFPSAVRTIGMGNGSYDFSSDFFPVEPGEQYEVKFKWWNGYPTMTGYVRPMIHIPGVVWLSPRANVGISDTAAGGTQPGDITAPGTSGEETIVYTQPANVGQVQVRMRATIGGNAEFFWRLEMRPTRSVDRGADVTIDNTAGSFVGAGALAFKNEAATFGVYSDDSDTAYLSYGTWHTVGTVSLAFAAGDKAVVTGDTWTIYDTDGFSSATLEVRLVRGATVLRTKPGGQIFVGTGAGAVIMDTDTPGAGTHSFTLQAKATLTGGSSAGWKARNRFLQVMKIT